MDGKYDLLIRDGRVIDTHQGLDGRLDIAVRGARVAAVAPRLDAGAAGDAACRVIDARGLIVCPGLIDLHVHVWEVANLGIAPDPHCVRRGATTVFDAGSAKIMVKLERLFTRWGEGGNGERGRDHGRRPRPYMLARSCCANRSSSDSR